MKTTGYRTAEELIEQLLTEKNFDLAYFFLDPASSDLSACGRYAELLTFMERQRPALEMYRAHLDGLVAPGLVLYDSDATGAFLKYAKLGGAVIHRGNFTHASLTGADLSKADFVYTLLVQTQLAGVNLYEANLRGANLSGAWAPKAYLTGADLSYANLNGAQLSSSRMKGSNLTRADFVGAVLYKADMTECKGLDTAFFGQTKVTKEQAKYLTGMGHPFTSSFHVID